MEGKDTYIIDMDGVLVHGARALPGAVAFIDRLNEKGCKFLILTNNSRYTPSDLEHRLQAAGFRISARHLYSSALATASFVKSQKPNGSAYILGGTGLYQALSEIGYILTDYNPDYVILGETDSYAYEKLVRAAQLIADGVPFVATNPDLTGPSESGNIPACGAVAALLEKASGYTPYYIGKPNPLMMRLALRHLDAHSENAVMVGDNMFTDIRAGMESGLATILVLSGVTKSGMLKNFPYRPTMVVGSVAEIEI